MAGELSSSDSPGCLGESKTPSGAGVLGDTALSDVIGMNPSVGSVLDGRDVESVLWPVLGGAAKEIRVPANPLDCEPGESIDGLLARPPQLSRTL